MGEPNSDFRPEAPELFISYSSANLDRASALADRHDSAREAVERLLRR
jgi:hypothetical protein